MPLIVHGLDSLRIAATIYSGENSPMSLSGAEIEARARTEDGATFTPTITVTDAAAGEILIEFAGGTFRGKAGDAELQVRVTIGQETQTVIAEPFRVSASII